MGGRAGRARIRGGAVGGAQRPVRALRHPAHDLLRADPRLDTRGAPVTDWLVLLPVIVLASCALLLAVLSFRVKNPALLWGVATGGLLVAILLTVDMMGLSWSRALGLGLWPVPGAGGPRALGRPQ